MDHAQRLFNWGVETALPYWVARAWDVRNDGFLESLTMTGEPVLDDVRRVRTQARQVYVFATAAREGWSDCLELAERGMAVLRQRAWAPDGQPGWVHLLRPDGVVESDVRDLYDHAFILLSLAGLYRASGDDLYLEWAAECLDFLDDAMASPFGGYAESVGGALYPRRQNPHMHLIEAFLALYEATGDFDVLDRASAVKSMFENHFFDHETALLREQFTDDWQPAPGDAADVAEPGHLSEWAWLLNEHARLSELAPSPLVDLLYQTVTEKGVNPRSGALHTAVRINGEVRDGASRTWMQTEWVRAAATQGKAEFEARCAVLLRHHIEPALPGGWIDRIDDQGQAASGHIPASTFYHLIGSVLEARRFAGPAVP
jgi:mannose/cellobiose epimerase-like protein (N-acyl-D-glucosamine 2-epimerase family)